MSNLNQNPKFLAACMWDYKPTIYAMDEQGTDWTETRANAFQFDEAGKAQTLAIRKANSQDGVAKVKGMNETILPTFPVVLKFNPELFPKISLIMQHDQAWVLYLLWRPRHIVNQYFDDECLAIGKRIEAEQPKTVIDLWRAFATQMSMATNFPSGDAMRFCEEALPFFMGERDVEYNVQAP